MAIPAVVFVVVSARFVSFQPMTHHPPPPASSHRFSFVFPPIFYAARECLAFRWAAGGKGAMLVLAV